MLARSLWFILFLEKKNHKRFTSDTGSSSYFSIQPLLPAARKGLFGLEEEADVVAPPADPQPVGSGISGGPCPPEEAKSEPSVSCGEPGGDTDSDFW